jgi:hypothetical protein
MYMLTSFRNFLISVLFLCVGVAHAQLIAVAKKKDKYGVIDSTGKWIAEPRYKALKNCLEGEYMMRLVYMSLAPSINSHSEEIPEEKFSNLLLFGILRFKNKDIQYIKLDDGTFFSNIRQGYFLRDERFSDSIYKTLRVFPVNIQNKSFYQEVSPQKVFNYYLLPKEELIVVGKDKEWFPIPPCFASQFLNAPFYNDNNEFLWERRDNFSYRPYLYGKVDDSIQKHLNLIKDTFYIKKWGAIDINHKVIISPQYPYPFEFSQGKALIGVKKGKNYQFFFINKQNKRLHKKNFVFARSFQENVALCKDKNSWFFIDTTMQRVFSLPQETMYADSFFEGMAVIAFEHQGSIFYGFVDKTGKLVINPQYKQVGYFSEGLAVAMDNSGKYGYINREGIWIILPQYTLTPFLDKNPETLNFHQSRVVFYDDILQKYGFLDKKGNVVLPAQFDELQPFYQVKP